MRGIGQMARDCGLSMSALRFYDGAGVLVPARVDPLSGYRFYSDAQVTSARLVARLRRVGMPVAEICVVLQHQRSRSVVEQVLQAHLTRLEDGLADARRGLSAALSLLDNHPERPMTITRVTMTGEALTAALREVRYAVSNDPELPMLGGVLLDAEGDTFRVVATDRYRLAVSAVSGASVAAGGGRDRAGRVGRRSARGAGRSRVGRGDPSDRRGRGHPRSRRAAPARRTPGP